MLVNICMEICQCVDLQWHTGKGRLSMEDNLQSTKEEEKNAMDKDYLQAKPP
jgi:endogenous inhibitor of DNA gyrase (YacG/DUF329 family)